MQDETENKVPDLGSVPQEVTVKNHKRNKPKPRLPNGKRPDYRSDKQPFDPEAPVAEAVTELETDENKPRSDGKIHKKQAVVKPPIREAKKSTANAHTSPREIAHQEKVAEALEYRRMGHSYPMIGQTMSISVGYAYELVAEGLHNIITEPATELYTLEMERLNEMLSSVYAAAAGGDIKAIETCLKIQERLDKLVGLERAADLAAARGTTINNNILIRLVGMDDNDDSDKPI